MGALVGAPVGAHEIAALAILRCVVLAHRESRVSFPNCRPKFLTLKTNFPEIFEDFVVRKKWSPLESHQNPCHFLSQNPQANL